MSNQRLTGNDTAVRSFLPEYPVDLHGSVIVIAELLNSSLDFFRGHGRRRS